VTPTMQATQGAETTPLSDEAILGIDADGAAGDGEYSPDAIDALEAELASAGMNDARDDANDDGAANGNREERRADGARGDKNGNRAERARDSGRGDKDGNRGENARGDKDGNRADDASEDKDGNRDESARDAQAKDEAQRDARDAQQRDANAERALPLTSLAEFDAGFYSGDAASRSALAQSLFASDPAAFRAMFDEAARLLGVTSRGNRADGNGYVAEAFRPPAVSSQNPDGGLKASATQDNNGNRASNDGAANGPTFANGAKMGHPNNTDQNRAETSSAPTKDNSQIAANNSANGAAFPAEAYRAFEASTNENVARDVRGAIAHTLEQVLPEGVAEGAAKRIGEDIFGEIGKLLAADAQLSAQVGSALRGWRFGSAEQQQVAALLAGRARQILPSVARRVIGEWTRTVLSTARTRAARSDAAARRVDVGGAASGSGEAAARGATRAMRPREIDYARTSDDDIFAM
jgi:hypothetical protein